MAGPLDLRLVRHASAARTTLTLTGIVSVAQALATAAIAWCAASAIAGFVAGSQVAPALLGLAAGIVVRSACLLLLDGIAVRGATRVKAQLRTLALDSIGAGGPDALAGRSSAEVATVLTTGLDALDGYFARYLPQLVLTAAAVPLLWAALLAADVETAVIVAVTMPVIPLFMVLVGLATRGVQATQWRSLQSLSRRFLETIDGLPTLTVFGRQHRQAVRITEATDEYRRRTMAVLRVTFVSGFVLELAGTLAVAVVAVAVGVRLVDGSLPLQIGLFVLLLVPDVFAPLRKVGAEFHASADGVAASDELFALVGEDRAPSPLDRAPARATGGVTLAVEFLTVRRGDAPVLDGLDARFEPGRLTVIAGPSGVGKSTLVAALLGFVRHEGRVLLDGRAVDDAREVIAWAPQHPSLAAGTVAENVAMGEPHPGLVAASLRLAAAEHLDPALELGVGGAGLSGGQAQRVAIARAVYRSLDRGAPVIVLDEPTSALDGDTEREVLAGLRELADRGRAVVVVSHRDAVVAAADHVVALGAAVRVPA